MTTEQNTTQNKIDLIASRRKMTRRQGIALENRVHSKRVRLFSFHRNRKQQILFLAKKTTKNID